MSETKRRPWGKWLAIAAAFVVALLVAVHYTISSSDAFAAASAFARNNSQVQRVAGQIQDTSLSWNGGEVEIVGDSGHAKFSVIVWGTIASPRVYVELNKRGIWEVTYARLLPESGESIVLQEAKQ
jgi:hypothetical protein